ncbi:uncharacterized protein PSFLO_06852 [Pseudozyma flocculosa]|uniref:Uncharacterized protein n=1 Tax=Pseudozyma flocculosa TaxID=84751 RepID=A0A5C3FAV6_9BASI|nr:uncharacterized protein PSFLO_06852 [Pseudozyma flocculosa]
MAPHFLPRHLAPVPSRGLAAPFLPRPALPRPALPRTARSPSIRPPCPRLRILASRSPSWTIASFLASSSGTPSFPLAFCSGSSRWDHGEPQHCLVLQLPLATDNALSLAHFSRSACLLRSPQLAWPKHRLVPVGPSELVPAGPLRARRSNATDAALMRFRNRFNSARRPTSQGRTLEKGKGGSRPDEPPSRTPDRPEVENLRTPGMRWIRILRASIVAARRGKSRVPAAVQMADAALAAWFGPAAAPQRQRVGQPRLRRATLVSLASLRLPNVQLEP